MAKTTKITLLTDRTYPHTWPGVDYELDYQFVSMEFAGEPEEGPRTMTGSVRVSISLEVIRLWQLAKDTLLSVLFQLAKRRIESMARWGTLGGIDEIVLWTSNADESCPYEPSRISRAFPTSFEVDRRVPYIATSEERSRIIELVSECSIPETGATEEGHFLQAMSGAPGPEWPRPRKAEAIRW